MSNPKRLNTDTIATSIQCLARVRMEYETDAADKNTPGYMRRNRLEQIEKIDRALNDLANHAKAP